MPVGYEKIKTTPIFMAWEVSVCEPQIYCLTSSKSQNVIAYENSMWS